MDENIVSLFHQASRTPPALLISFTFRKSLLPLLGIVDIWSGDLKLCVLNNLSDDSRIEDGQF